MSPKIKSLQIDRIIAPARGGLVPARIFSDYLSVPISTMTIQSYSDLKQIKEPRITEKPKLTKKDKTILIVDDVSDTGKTFIKILDYFNKAKKVRGCPIEKIYTLSVYTKPWTKFTPDFYKEEIDAWIIFPYELKETVCAFSKMFPTREETTENLLKVGYGKEEIEKLLSL